MKDFKKAVKALNNSTIFSTIVAGLGYDRVGLQITQKGTDLIAFTSYNKNGKIVKVEEGLDDPAFVTHIEEEVFDKFTQADELAWMEEHPVLAVKKYLRSVKMPFSIKLKIGKLFLKGMKG